MSAAQPKLRTVNDWQGATAHRPRVGNCPTCDADPGHQVLINVDTSRPEWRCTRCHTTTSAQLPWNPTAAPDGKSEIQLAIATLTIYAPILGAVDVDKVYRIVWPYFTKGWCVRDVLHAMDYLPDGSTHRGGGVAWVRGEPADTTLARLYLRLRTWRWSDVDGDDGQDIMAGPYTSMRTEMKTRAAVQKAEAAERAERWEREAALAQTAVDRDASAGARRVAMVAATQARQLRVIAQRREAEHMAAEFARGKAAAEAWRKLIDDEPPDDTAS